MTEAWKDIAGYEGMYQVSNYGRIKSFKGRKPRIIKPWLNFGYENIVLCDKEYRKHKHKVHRLVAMAFIDNPNNYPEINHKDKNRANNYFENLEWCNRQYNVDYSNSKKVIRKKGKETKVYVSVKAAADDLGIPCPNIVACCNKYQYCHTAGGYEWEYAR